MMANFDGIVSLDRIRNAWPSAHQEQQRIEKEHLLTHNHINIVHYTDCQQLIIHLPVHGHIYNNIIVNEAITGEVIFQKSVNAILNGSTQMIIDTHPFAPAEYTIFIARNDGLTHYIDITKREKDATSLEVFNDEKKHVSENVYKDGSGNTIAEQDMIIKTKIYQEMTNKFKRRVAFEGSGRSHNVIYSDGIKSINFYSEFGGGDCLFYISIPSVENWEVETGFSVEERDEILQFVAETTLREQTSSNGAYFVIEDKWINFYKSK